jgi:hypothetical protein
MPCCTLSTENYVTRPQKKFKVKRSEKHVVIGTVRYKITLKYGEKSPYVRLAGTVTLNVKRINCFK